MKKILLYFWLILCPISAFSQYNVLQTPSDETKKEEISKLDLLRHRYIGKHIQFFPRNSNTTSMQWFHYGNFMRMIR